MDEVWQEKKCRCLYLEQLALLSQEQLEELRGRFVAVRDFDDGEIVAVGGEGEKSVDLKKRAALIHKDPVVFWIPLTAYTWVLIRELRKKILKS